MIHTENLNSKFLIRLPKNTFKKQRRQIKSNDKIISINLTKSIIKNFERDELKEIAKNMGRLKIRIVEIKLENGTVEILATNLDSDEFSLEDLRELYSKRWSIETGFKKLKSQVQIENFSGYRRTIIEQDFYAKIFVYNLATAIQWDANQRLSIKKRNPAVEYIYKSSFSTIVGNIFVYFETILTNDKNLINKAVDFLIKQAKRLYYQKIRDLISYLKFCKNYEDRVLQLLWGDDWENKKEQRTAKDPTNDHPGNPKNTH